MVGRFLASACLCLAFAFACGPTPEGLRADANRSGGGDGGPPVPGSLRIEPASVTLTVAGGVAATQEFRAIYTDDGGADHDVTDEALWSVLDATLGAFTANVFTSATNK